MATRNPPPRAFKDVDEAREHLEKYCGDSSFRNLSTRGKNGEARGLYHTRLLWLNNPTHRWFANVQETWEHLNPGCSWDDFKRECATDPYTKWWTPTDSKLPAIFHLFNERVGSPPRFSLVTRVLFKCTAIPGSMFLVCTLMSWPPALCILSAPGLVFAACAECVQNRDHIPTPNAYLYTPSYKQAHELWVYHAAPPKGRQFFKRH